MAPGTLILRRGQQINAHGAITGSQKVLLPACVQACPTGARKFGDLKDENSEVKKIIDEERINLLKPDLGTKPKVFYIGLDREVK